MWRGEPERREGIGVAAATTKDGSNPNFDMWYADSKV